MATRGGGHFSGYTQVSVHPDKQGGHYYTATVMVTLTSRPS